MLVQAVGKSGEKGKIATMIQVRSKMNEVKVWRGMNCCSSVCLAEQSWAPVIGQGLDRVFPQGLCEVCIVLLTCMIIYINVSGLEEEDKCLYAVFP